MNSKLPVSNAHCVTLSQNYLIIGLPYKSDVTDALSKKLTPRSKLKVVTNFVSKHTLRSTSYAKLSRFCKISKLDRCVLTQTILEVLPMKSVIYNTGAGSTVFLE